MEWLWSLEGGLAVASLLAIVLVVAFVVAGQRRKHAQRRRQIAIPGPEAAIPAEAPPEPPPAPPVPRLRTALAKSREAFRQRLDLIFRQRELDGFFPALEEALVSADVGMATTAKILERVRRRLGASERLSEEEVRLALVASIEETLGESSEPDRSCKPWVILVGGVNGVGKTTTIAKLAARFRKEERKVLLIAADTFRAAAVDQLGIWAERVGAVFVRHQSGSDPGAVAFDGVKAAVARDIDVVLVDTAGRLHTRGNLMEELRKVSRVLGKALPGAPHEVLLVLDATTGQNALNQAKVFTEALGVTGIVLTKLDGTAKGGAALAVREELGIPIRYVGLGERIEDLRTLKAAEFAAALVGGVEADDFTHTDQRVNHAR